MTEPELKQDNAPNKPEHPFKPNNIPPPPSLNSDFDFVTDNCFFKSAMAGVMGGGLGFAFGTMFGAHYAPSPEELEKPFMRQVTDGFKTAGRSGLQTGKNFAMVGALYAGTECAIEHYRAKTDIWNSVSAGCISGGILAARVGPKASVVGCVSFAAFGVAIDHFTGRHDESTRIHHEDKY